MKLARVWTGASIAAGLAMALLAIAAQAQTYSVLHSFTDGLDGGYPYAGVTRDSEGNLYGTTVSGGPSNVGTIFKMSKTGKLTVVYSFDCYNGNACVAETGVIRDPKGNLYGTTSAGGAYGFGTVFQLSKPPKETAVLYSFPEWEGRNGPNGVIRDAKGNLYGTTPYGGTYGFGMVIKVDKFGNETTLYNFTGFTDGANPYAGVVRDAEGNLYGTTFDGGSKKCPKGSGGCGWGNIFKLSKTGKETVLYTFTGTEWGPRGVVLDAEGNLYGTSFGGAYGYGTVFKLDGSRKLTVLYSLSPAEGDGPIGVIR